MTKLRTPLTFADAMMDVAGVIGWVGARKVVGKSDRLLRRWSEPDQAAVPSLTQALALDRAYRVAGGEGSPFLEALAHQIDVQVAAVTADHRELIDEAAEVARECGEAVAAAIAVSSGHATPLATHHALAQANEAHTAIGALVRRLTSFLPFGTGSDTGKAGGTHE